MKPMKPDELHSITFEGYYVDWIDIEDYRTLYQQYMALREAAEKVHSEFYNESIQNLRKTLRGDEK